MVATMRYLLFICISILLIGCDHFPGPNVRNEFPTQVKITISYSDGMTFSHEWPSCRVLKLGAMETGKWGVKPKEGISIDKIIVEAEGKVVHRLNKVAINTLIEKTKEQRGYPIWVIDSSGIRFSTDRECSLNKNKSSQ